MIDKELFYKKLNKKGKVTVQGLGTWYKLPKKKGKIFNGFTGEETKANYQNRIKFVSSKTLKDNTCG